MNTQDDKLKKMIENKTLEVIKTYMKSSAFTDRKLTDTPTDNLSVVNRRFVTLNGVSANRPVSSVVGQQYLDMTLASGRGKPVWWNGTGFVDADGTYV